MYFWNIEKLKSKLTVSPLTEREVLPYLLVFVGLYELKDIIPSQEMNVWDYVDGVWTFVLSLLGTIYIYYRNGGNSGRHFLQRYLAIGWVVAIRVTAILILILIPYVYLVGFSAKTTWHFTLIFSLAELVLYERIGRHVHDLAKRESEI